jgi:predicted metal-dependent hydrolase
MTTTPQTELVVDDLHFEIRRSARRKTLELIVDRGGELIIAAPDDLAESVMEEFVREKRFWLYTKIAEKEARRHETTDKEFVDGEGFPYLGRSYRLLLVDDQGVPLKLVSGRFCLRRELAAEGRDVFVDWYTEHAEVWLERRVGEWASRMGLGVAGIDVQELGFRWGSCSNSGNLNFHWATILLPASIVDYVIVHELAHLREPHHSSEFWRVVERTMPVYERRKTWLASHGHRELL